MKNLLITGILALIFVFNCMSETTESIDFSDMNKVLPFDKNVKTGVLPNGMKYYIRKNNKPENRAHFRLVLNAGALDEDDDQNGLAHFCEHMAFNGTKNFPKDELIDFLQKNGISFGSDINASTNLERTMYELPIPMNDENLVKSAFQILSDWAHNMSFEDSQIDGERGVIVSEWRQRNNYNFRLNYKAYKYIYKDSKLTKRDIIGDTAILKNFKYDVIRRFYKDWYRPDLMALVAVGDFDVNKIESMIKEYFSPINNPAKPRKKEYVTVKYHKEPIAASLTDKELPYDIGNVYFKLPEYKTNTYQGFIESIKRNLFDIMFNERIQDLSKIANPPFIQAGGGESDILGDLRSFNLYVVSPPGGMMKGLEAVMTEAVRVKQHGFTQTELDRAKKNMKAEFDKYLAEKNTVLNGRYVEEYTRVFNKKEAASGIDFEHAFVSQILPKLTLKEINDLANLYIRKENTVIIAEFPENDKDIKTDSELLSYFNKALKKNTEPFVDKTISKPLISKQIKPGTIIDKKNDDKLGITTYKLSNGAKVILKKTDFKDDEILIDVFSKGGLTYADEKSFEKCRLADQIIASSGIGDFDQASLEKQMTGKNLYLQPYFDDYTEGMKASSSKVDFETAMQLIYLYFTEPRKDKNAFNSYMSKLNGFLSSKANNPESVFEDSSEVTLYNYNTRKLPLTTENVSKLNLDEMYKFYKDRFNSASDFTFIFVGDLNTEEAEKYIEKYIASLPSNGTNENYKDVGLRYPSKSITKSFQKGKQERTKVRITIPTDFTWSALDRQRFNSMVDLLRIKVTEIIREKMAGIYSPAVHPDFEEFPVQTSSVIIEYVCKPEMTDEIIKTTFDICDDLKKNEDQVGTEKVKKAQEKNLEVRRKNNTYWLNSISQYLRSGEDLNNFLKNNEYISTLQPKDIKEQASKHLLKEKAIIIINEPEK